MRRVRQFGFVLATCVVFWVGSIAAQAPNLVPATTADAPKFEVASIRLIPAKDVVPIAGSPLSPSGAGLFTMREVTLEFAIEWAFKVDAMQLVGRTEWLNTQFYEITAKSEGDTGLSYDQLRPLVQQLIEERFHLTYHLETKQHKGYTLVVAREGPKLTPTKGAAGNGYIMNDRIRAANLPVKGLASMLTRVLNEPVVDQTGIKGNCDVQLDFAPVNGEEPQLLNGAAPDLPSIFTAVEEQLGLKLVSQEVPLQMFVIDHVERVPTAN
jgi:uncharacterized protein (TIGR03435 family)